LGHFGVISKLLGTGVTVVPRSGDVLRVTRAASVQFIEPLLFRVIRVHDWPTYDGWVWLDGYELNASGDAVERRSIFVQVDGLQTANGGPFARVDSSARSRVVSNAGRTMNNNNTRLRAHQPAG
jgi:hypothetical protein